MLESYPRLTPEMIRLALIYAATYPLRGRPRKQLRADRPPIPPAARHDPSIVKFLIDECLSIDLVPVTGRAGHEAYHVAHIGDASQKDWNALHYARDRDFVFVTKNAIFGVSVRRRRSMPGSSSCSTIGRDLQKKLFRAALDELGVIGSRSTSARAQTQRRGRNCYTLRSSGGRAADARRLHRQSDSRLSHSYHCLYSYTALAEV